MDVKLRHILLVEDNEEDRELTIDALKKSNILNVVDTVKDGADALDYIFCSGKYQDRSSGNPAVILLDLKLPKINGIEVLKKIRENPKTVTIPVVILTSSKEERDIFDGYKFGTNAYVVKPVAFENFMQAVNVLGAFWGLVNEPPVN